jgi:hypothetical protein
MPVGNVVSKQAKVANKMELTHELKAVASNCIKSLSFCQDPPSYAQGTRWTLSHPAHSSDPIHGCLKYWNTFGSTQVGNVVCSYYKV